MSCTRTSHLITSKDAPDAPLQRAGHGQIVETPTARSTIRTLARGRAEGCGARRSAARRRFQKCVWRDDGWLSLAERRPGARRRGGRAGHVSRAQCRAARYAFSPRGASAAQISSGCGRHVRSGSSRLAPVPAGCGLIGRRIDRLLVRAGDGRAPPGAFRLPRRDRARIRASDLSTGGRPDRILQSLQIPLSARHVGRGPGTVPSRCSVASGDYPEGRLNFPLARSIAIGEGRVKLAVAVDRARLQFAYALSDGRLAGSGSRPRRFDPFGRSGRRRASFLYGSVRRHVGVRCVGRRCPCRLQLLRV